MILGLTQKTFLTIFVMFLLVCFFIAEIIWLYGQRQLNKDYKKYGLKRHTYFSDILQIVIIILLQCFVLYLYLSTISTLP